MKAKPANRPPTDASRQLGKELRRSRLANYPLDAKRFPPRLVGQDDVFEAWFNEHVVEYIVPLLIRSQTSERLDNTPKLSEEDICDVFFQIYDHDAEYNDISLAAREVGKARIKERVHYILSEYATSQGMGNDAAAFAVTARTLSNRELEEFVKRGEVAKVELAARGAIDRATAEPRLDEPSKEITTRKRGPRVKPNPALPKEAPEIYRDRKPREELGGRKENIVQFVERAYAPCREILTRADLRRLDEPADAAVERWINKGKQLPKGLLLTEYELNIDKRLLEGKRRPKRRFARTLRGDPPALDKKDL